MLLRIGHKRGDGMSVWARISGFLSGFYRRIDACTAIQNQFSARPQPERSSVGIETRESLFAFLPGVIGRAHHDGRIAIILAAFPDRGRRRLRCMIGSK
jgi:hypothetical protein